MAPGSGQRAAGSLQASGRRYVLVLAVSRSHFSSCRLGQQRPIDRRAAEMAVGEKRERAERRCAAGRLDLFPALGRQPALCTSGPDFSLGPSLTEARGGCGAVGRRLIGWRRTWAVTAVSCLVVPGRFVGGRPKALLPNGAASASATPFVASRGSPTPGRSNIRCRVAS